MRRSGFKTTFLITLLFIIFTILTLNASADDKKIIGIIMIPNIEYYKDIHKAFIETLSSEGITEKNVDIITQKPLPDRISLKNTARKFAAINTDVMVSYGAPASLASVGEQSDIPVVFAGVFDHKAVGVSLRNATGVSSNVSVKSLLKKFKMIKDFSKLGVLYSDSEKDTVFQADEVKRIGATLGYRSVMINIRRASDIAKISGVDALLLTTSCPALYCIKDIIDIAKRENIPTASLIGGEEERGVILSIYANPQEQGRKAAELVARVLNGERVSDFPVSTPEEVEIVLNVKDASIMGLKIPNHIIDSSTRVIK